MANRSLLICADDIAFPTEGQEPSHVQPRTFRLSVASVLALPQSGSRVLPRLKWVWNGIRRRFQHCPANQHPRVADINREGMLHEITVGHGTNTGLNASRVCSDMPVNEETFWHWNVQSNLKTILSFIAGRIRLSLYIAS